MVEWSKVFPSFSHSLSFAYVSVCQSEIFRICFFFFLLVIWCMCMSVRVFISSVDMHIWQNRRRLLSSRMSQFQKSKLVCIIYTLVWSNKRLSFILSNTQLKGGKNRRSRRSREKTTKIRNTLIIFDIGCNIIIIPFFFIILFIFIAFILFQTESIETNSHTQSAVNRMRNNTNCS